MKKMVFFVILASFTFLLGAQESFRLQLDEYQSIENNDGSMGGQLKFPNSNQVVVLGGLNDADGMNNYFNLFGGKLIIDRMSQESDGIQKVILRREDGRDFFDLFPTVSARLIPLDHPENTDSKKSTTIFKTNE